MLKKGKKKKKDRIAIKTWDYKTDSQGRDLQNLKYLKKNNNNNNLKKKKKKNPISFEE